MVIPEIKSWNRWDHPGTRWMDKWMDELSWFFACWCKFRKVKNYFNYFCRLRHMRRAIAGACLYARLKHWRREKKKHPTRSRRSYNTKDLTRKSFIFICFINLMVKIVFSEVSLVSFWIIQNTWWKIRYNL